MSKGPFRAILIDATSREISVVVVTDFRSIQKAIGCDCFTTAFRLPKNGICYVDDEGLINGTQTFFKFRGDLGERIFAGNGLIMGGTRGGNSADSTEDVEEIRKRVTFLTPLEALLEARRLGL